MLLVPHRSSKILPTNASQVVHFRNVFLRDFSCCGIHLCPLLHRLECMLKRKHFSLSTNLCQGLRFGTAASLGEHCRRCLFVAMCTIIFMGFLEHADIGLPREILRVDRGDLKISHVTRPVLYQWVLSKRFLTLFLRMLLGDFCSLLIV